MRVCVRACADWPSEPLPAGLLGAGPGESSDGVVGVGEAPRQALTPAVHRRISAGASSAPARQGWLVPCLPDSAASGWRLKERFNKKRWVVCSKGSLYVFPKVGAKEPSAILSLDLYDVAIGSLVRSFTFELRSADGATATFEAPTEAELVEWVNSLVLHKTALKDSQGELDSLEVEEVGDGTSAAAAELSSSSLESGGVPIVLTPPRKADLKKRMTSGVTVLKYNESGRGGPPKTKALWVSSDASLICWQDLAGDASSAKRQRSASLLAVRPGCSTKAFARSPPPDSLLCFSLIFQDRSLDVQMSTTAAKNLWVGYFNHLLQCTHEGKAIW